MNLRQQYEKLSQELDSEEYNLHSLKAQIEEIEGLEAIANKIINSAMRIGILQEKLTTIEGYMSQGNE